jgi:hypothetical protein
MSPPEKEGTYRGEPGLRSWREAIMGFIPD